MKRFCIIISIILFISLQNKAQKSKPKDTEDWSQKPEIVTVEEGTIPSDAIVLFNGKDLSEWQGKDGEVKWKVSKKSMTIVKGTGGIFTKKKFGDIQLHIEWRSPKKVDGKGQGRGNSGVYLQNRYEVQVLDSYQNETYYNGQAGSIYKQYIPLVNASRKPGKWQTYDIIFIAPRFNADNSLKTAGRITVIHNGVLIQHNVELKGPTVFNGKPEYKFHPEKEPIMLQNHTNPVSYRNIWVRELKL